MRTSIFSLGILLCLCLRLHAQQEREELLKLYNQLGGPAWVDTIRWDITKPYSLWRGLNLSGNSVICIDLDGSLGISCGFSGKMTPGFNLVGQIPSLSLNRLQTLSLSDNIGVNDSVPSLSGLPELRNLYIDNCRLTGGLQNLTTGLRLERISLQGNMTLKEQIPPNLFENPFLMSLLLHNNDLYGPIPAPPGYSGITSFSISRNRFTFSDIMPFRDAMQKRIQSQTITFFYELQKNIPMQSPIRAPIGFPLVIDVKKDDGLAGTVFTWSQNDQAFDTVIESSKLQFDSIKSTDQGTYFCKITNPKLPLLTLTTDQVQINVCSPGVKKLTGPRCAGQSELVNSQVYDELNPHDTIFLPNLANNGCDSIVVVDLKYSALNKFDKIICPGTNFTVGDTVLRTAGLHKVLIKRALPFVCDSMVIVNLSVDDESKLGAANAGKDTTICAPQVTLKGNLLPNTTGQWRNVQTGATLAAGTPNLTLNQLNPGLNQFSWSLSSATCPNYSARTISVNYETSPQLTDDFFTITEGDTTIFDPVENDVFLDQQLWNFRWLNRPSVGNFQSQDTRGKFSYTLAKGKPQTLNFDYQICSQRCTSLCADANVNLKIVPVINEKVNQPNVISPNGDGYNDVFIIGVMDKDPLKYAENEFVVYNEQQQVVFKTKNYRNDWGGWNQKGQELPLGTYYFTFVSAPLKQYLRGPILIIE